MAILEIFPVKIGVYDYPDLVEETLAMNKKYLDNDEIVGYRWNYANTYDTGYKNPSLFGDDYKQLQKKIKQALDVYLTDRGIDIPEEEPRITLFFSKMNKGEKHDKHSHNNSHFSGVFYLEMPEGSSDICFYSEDGTESKTITPHSGMMLIWESWLTHEVLPSKADGRRTAVFNIVYDNI